MDGEGMSSDNYNMIIQREDGKWIASPNHSMSDLMSREEAEAYRNALELVRGTDPVYDTQSEAWDAAEGEYSEYGTFSHEWRDWFSDYE